MQKECKGKYHGSGIKYIDDDQKYCLICQQEYERRKKKTKEIFGAIGSAVFVGVGFIIKACLGNKDGNET